MQTAEWAKNASTYMFFPKGALQGPTINKLSSEGSDERLMNTNLANSPRITNYVNFKLGMATNLGWYANKLGMVTNS